MSTSQILLFLERYFYDKRWSTVPLFSLIYAEETAVSLVTTLWLVLWSVHLPTSAPEFCANQEVPKILQFLQRPLEDGCIREQFLQLLMLKRPN